MLATIGACIGLDNVALWDSPWDWAVTGWSGLAAGRRRVVRQGAAREQRIRRWLMDVEGRRFQVLLFGPLTGAGGRGGPAGPYFGDTVTCGTLRDRIQQQYPHMATMSWILPVCR